MVIKILKGLGIAFLTFLVIDIVILILFMVVRREPDSRVIKSFTMNCRLADNDYQILIGNNGHFDCNNCDKKMKVYLNDITDWANADHSIKNIKTYFNDNGGSCDSVE